METLHPRAIELGLARVRAVQARMQLTEVPFPVVTVGGTNGKGSTVAMLSAAYTAAGYKVGSYTSPHLIDYNERVRIGAQFASDAQLCAAFARVEAARGDTQLTYFEFGTLAAVDLFVHERVEVAILEVGLGGRLDAVNAWESDVAIVTSIGTDHQDWLGPDRETIGAEKAGIFRAGKAAICADPQPPASVLQTAAAIGAELYLVERDFQFAREPGGWRWWHRDCVRSGLPYPAMRGDYQLYNAAAALMALHLMNARLPIKLADIRAALVGAVLPGRFQTLAGTPVTVLDVAHNIEAAQALAQTLRAQTVAGETYAVVGMLNDKPIVEVLRMLAPLVSVWHVATLANARGATAADLVKAARAGGVTVPIFAYDDVATAYAAARTQAQTRDRIVAFGSFYTVGAILRAASPH